MQTRYSTFKRYLPVFFTGIIVLLLTSCASYYNAGILKTVKAKPIITNNISNPRIRPSKTFPKKVPFSLTLTPILPRKV